MVTNKELMYFANSDEAQDSQVEDILNQFDRNWKHDQTSFPIEFLEVITPMVQQVDEYIPFSEEERAAIDNFYKLKDGYDIESTNNISMMDALTKVVELHSFVARFPKVLPVVGADAINNGVYISVFLAVLATVIDLAANLAKTVDTDGLSDEEIIKVVTSLAEAMGASKDKKTSMH